MPIIRHAWYRTYQAIMRAASYVLPFRTPELLDGPGSIRRLPAFIAAKGYGTLLVVTDKGLTSLGLLDGFLAGLKDAGIVHALYDGVQANPTIGNIEEALAMYAARGCQAIVAFGGGSPMDCAKGVAARVGNPGLSIPRMRGLLKVRRKAAPLFAVPTTAGTGSETTLAAVITDPSTHEKYSITDPHLIPAWAVLDPELTTGLPPHITSTTGMDALTHAVEAYIGRSNTRVTKEKAEQAVALIFRSLERAYGNGSDLAARSDMLLAAHYAGIAFTRAYIGYVHAIAHNLGGLYGVPHGLANAVILPYVLDWFGKAAHAPLARLADIAGVSAPGMDGAGKAAAFIEAVRGLNKRMKIPETIDRIKEEDIPLIVRRALAEAHPLYPVPRFMEASDCEALVRRLMGQ